MLCSLWELEKTPINVFVLEKYIRNYNKNSDKVLLISGLKEGFLLQYTGPRLPVYSNILISAEINRFETLTKSQKEINLGRMIGHFIDQPISNLRISPIGLVDKSYDTWRLITNLSYPTDNSVSKFIDEHFCTVSYSSFDKAINTICSLGHSAQLGKFYIRQAFILLIVNPENVDLQGIMFDGNYNADKYLLMGWSISCTFLRTLSLFCIGL